MIERSAKGAKGPSPIHKAGSQCGQCKGNVNNDSSGIPSEQQEHREHHERVVARTLEHGRGEDGEVVSL